MKANEIIARLNHAKERPADAYRRLKRRIILRIGGIDLSKQTELQYIEIENFDSKILNDVESTNKTNYYCVFYYLKRFIGWEG